MNVYLEAYIWAAIGFGFLQTIIIIKDPPELARYAVLFYVTTPFMPLIATLTVPVAIYKGVEHAWVTELRKYRLRVKKR